MTSLTVVGIDRYSRGWVGAVLRGADAPTFRVGQALGALIAGISGVDSVGVDMPIGLPPSGVRDADVQARVFVGPRRSSVFMTPPRAVLEADSFAQANELAPALLEGGKISRQAWALKSTIAEVEDCADSDDRIIEVHPEVSFRAMAGEDLTFSKHTWNGVALRRQMLASEGLVIPDILATGGEVPPADLLDALAAAWSARRYATGHASALPGTATPGQRGAITF